MSLPYNAPKWTDGPLGIATPDSLPVFSSPISGVTGEYIFKQRFKQFRNQFAQLDVGAAPPVQHPDYPGYYIVAEGDRQEVAGGLVVWERTYAKVPATHNEFESFGYPFIGMIQLVVGGASQTRTTRTWEVTSRVQHDYFVMGKSQTDPITGRTYTPATAGDVDKILAMQYVYQASSGGITYGGVSLAVDQLNPSSASPPTIPTSEAYLTMISDAIANKWGAGVSKIVVSSGGGGNLPGNILTGSSNYAGQIPARDSRISRWQGNIWLRVTRYVLAQ